MGDDWDIGGNNDDNEWNDAHTQQASANRVEFDPEYVLKKLGIEIRSAYDGDMVLCEGKQRIVKSREKDDNTKEGYNDAF
ncbi:hypothetical protein THOM_2470 [Trachipleistophora hominis]|uniref:Uncharacterized protein n=1 Tax=Trachipleistophora hominis TaxID=72359 RepID=L7JUW3_TRAHO|nr:hypothetical protein THOM_2470 [Trachipleistophora hominis]